MPQKSVWAEVDELLGPPQPSVWDDVDAVLSTPALGPSTDLEREVVAASPAARSLTKPTAEDIFGLSKPPAPIDPVVTPPPPPTAGRGTGFDPAVAQQRISSVLPTITPPKPAPAAPPTATAGRGTGLDVAASQRRSAAALGGTLDLAAGVLQAPVGALQSVPAAIGEQVFDQTLPGHEGEPQTLFGRAAHHLGMTVRGQGGAVVPPMAPFNPMAQPPDETPTVESLMARGPSAMAPNAKIGEIVNRGIGQAAKMLQDPSFVAMGLVNGTTAEALAAVNSAIGVKAAVDTAQDPAASDVDVAESVLTALIMAAPMGAQIARKASARVGELARSFREQAAAVADQVRANPELGVSVNVGPFEIPLRKPSAPPPAGELAPAGDIWTQVDEVLDTPPPAPAEPSVATDTQLGNVEPVAKPTIEDLTHQRVLDKLARGEQLGTPGARADLERRQQLEDRRAQVRATVDATLSDETKAAVDQVLQEQPNAETAVSIPEETLPETAAAASDVARPGEAVPQADAATAVTTPPEQSPVYFRSGATRPNDFDGLADAGVPIGVTATELSKPMTQRVVEHVNRGGKVFVDSGAFGGTVDFDALMTRYHELADRIEPSQRAELYVVAPDVVGDARATQQLQADHGAQLRALTDKGVNVILPVQKSADESLISQIHQLFVTIIDGPRNPRVVIGIPFNKAAFTAEEVADALRQLAVDKPRVHLLGMGDRNAGYQAALATIRAAKPDVVLSSDSNRLAAMFGAGRPAQQAVTAKVEERAPEHVDVDADKDTTELWGALGSGRAGDFTAAEWARLAKAVDQDPRELTRRATRGGDDWRAFIDLWDVTLDNTIAQIALERARKGERPGARREVIAEAEKSRSAEIADIIDGRTRYVVLADGSVNRWLAVGKSGKRWKSDGKVKPGADDYLPPAVREAIAATQTSAPTERVTIEDLTNGEAPAGEITPDSAPERPEVAGGGSAPRGRDPKRARARRAEEEAVRARAEAEALDGLVEKAKAAGHVGDHELLRRELHDRLQLIKELDTEFESSGHNPDALLREIARFGGLSVDRETGLKGELRWLKEFQDLKPSASRKNLKAPPVLAGTMRGIRGVFRKDGLSVDDMLTSLRQDPRFTHLETFNDLLEEIRAAAMAEHDSSAIERLEKGLGERWWDTIGEGGDLEAIDDALDAGDGDITFDPQELEGGAVDVLDTGEQQPRLAGAGEARQVGKADTTFRAPAQASGDDFTLETLLSDDARAREAKEAKGPSMFDDEPDATPSQARDIMEQLSKKTAEQPRFEAPESTAVKVKREADRQFVAERPMPPKVVESEPFDVRGTKTIRLELGDKAIGLEKQPGKRRYEWEIVRYETQPDDTYVRKVLESGYTLERARMRGTALLQHEWITANWPADMAETVDEFMKSGRGGGSTNVSGFPAINVPSRAVKMQNLALPDQSRALPAVRKPGTLEQILRRKKPALPVSDIVARLSKLFRVPVAEGGFPHKALGLYFNRTEVIRLANMSDLQVLSHEFGHHVDLAIMGGSDIFNRGKIAKELKAVGAPTSLPSYTAQQRRREGTAEFFRRWLVEPDTLPGEAPLYTAAFEKYRAMHPKLARELDRIRDEVRRYVSLPPLEQARLHVDFDGGGTQVLKKAQQIAELAKDEPARRRAIAYLSAQWVDDLAFIRLAEQDMADGQPVDAGASAYVQARLARGHAGKAEGFLEFGVRAEDGTFIGPSFDDVVAAVGGRVNDFALYVAAKRAHTMERRGKISGFTKAQLEAALALETPEFKAAAEKLYDFNRAKLDYMVRGGVLSPEARAKIAKVEPHYVPYWRVRDEVEGFLTGKKIANRSTPVKRLKGSGRRVVNPLETVIRNTHLEVGTVEQNRAMQKLAARVLATQGSGKWMEEIPEPKVATTFNLVKLREQISEVLAELEVELPDGGLTLDEYLDTLVTVFTPRQFATGKNRIITVLEGGKLRWFQVHDEGLYDALTAVGPAGTEEIVKMFFRGAQVLRRMATSTLGFAIRNPIKDQVSAAVQSRAGYRPGVDFARGLFEYLGKGEKFQLYLNAGADQATIIADDRDVLRRRLRGLGHSKVRKLLDSTVLNPFDGLRAIQQAGETATRLGEFMRTLERADFDAIDARPLLPGDSEGPTVEGAMEASRARRSALAQAALNARDVTQDFQKAGKQPRVWNRYTAFFSARVGGLARMWEAARENPTGFVWRAAAAIALPSLLLWVLNHDDDEYNELPAWERNYYWHVPIVGLDGKRTGFIRFPKPFELGQIFGTNVELALEWLLKDDPTIAGRLITKNDALQLIQQAIPTALLPWIEVAANYDFFRGRQIVSPWQEDLAPELQFNRWTSETAKTLGELLGVSPAKLEMIIYGYTAGVGQGALRAADPFLGSKKPAGGAGQLPGIGALYRPLATSDAQSLSDFYTSRDALAGLKASVKEWRAMGDNDRADRAIAAARPQFGKIEGRLGPGESAIKRFRTDVNRVFADPQLTPAQKRKALDVLYLDMLQIARAALGRKPLARPKMTLEQVLGK